MHPANVQRRAACQNSCVSSHHTQVKSFRATAIMSLINREAVCCVLFMRLRIVNEELPTAPDAAAVGATGEGKSNTASQLCNSAK